MAALLANVLSEQPGMQVFILSKSMSGVSSFYSFHENIHCDVLDRYRFHGLRSLISNIFKLKKYLQTNKIDAVIVVDAALGLFTLPVQLISRKRMYIYWDHFSTTFSDGNKRMNWLRKLAGKMGNAYITLTEEDAAAISKWTGKKAICIRNFSPYPEASGSCDLSSRRIISVGNIIPVKGFDMAIQIAAKVLSTHPDWEWQFYGDGPSLQSLMLQADQTSVKDRIRFCGRVHNMEEVYRKAAFLVMTSRSEGYGLVLAEAQAFHLPTVAFDVPYGPRNIIRDGTDGFLIEPFNTDRMAQKISLLMDRPDLRKQFSEALVGKTNRTNEESEKAWLELLSQ